jgi:hypothetical protein
VVILHIEYQLRGYTCTPGPYQQELAPVTVIALLQELLLLLLLLLVVVVQLLLLVGAPAKRKQ